MDAGELAVAALTGSVGAVVAIVGSVAALAITWRKERRDAAGREREAATAQAARERAERIARVRTAVNRDLMRSASRWAGLGLHRGLIEVYGALSEVVVHEAAGHPAVSQWAMEQLEEFGRAVRRAERWWLLPGHRRRLAKVAATPVDAATALTYWQAGHLSDDWFAHHSKAVAALRSDEG